MSMQKRILLDRAVLLSFAMEQSKTVRSGAASTTEEILNNYSQALYESPGMSAIEHVLRSAEKLSGILVAIPNNFPLELDNSDAKKLAAMVAEWSLKVPVMHAVQLLERQLVGPTRTAGEHIGYVVRLLLLARHFNADILPWWPRAALLRAMLESANYTIEIHEASHGVTLITGSCPNDKSLPEVIATDFHIICAQPIRKMTSDREINTDTLHTSGTSHSDEATSVFMSYSHKDKKWFDLVASHLRPLTTSSRIKAWSDREIEAGESWESEIRKAIDTANVAVLLVTPSFLASDFIMKTELPLIFRGAAAKRLKVLWIAVSSALFDETELKNYQAANNPDAPLDMLPPAARNRELVRICKSIRDSMIL